MKKQKVLFIDRDGTLIIEPPVTFQVDSLDLLEFIPGCITALNKINTLLDYELVMISNQDGLGTPSYPEEKFNMVQNKMLKTMAGEQIIFKEILIDKSFETDNLPTRKPGTALLQKYFGPEYDLANSFVIGDRQTDLELAKNLGAKAILLTNHLHTKNIHKEYINKTSLVTDKWTDIYSYLRKFQRTLNYDRKTNETDVNINLSLDGSGITAIKTGLSFFDHMLDQLGKHSGMDLTIAIVGDLNVDEHHTIEDTGIALGEAINKALGNKSGIERYAFVLPMDDCLAQVAIDFGGRPWLVWDAEFKREKIGDMPTEMFYHFFKSFCDGARCNLNIKADGINEHHKIESIFKGFARCIKQAVKRNEENLSLPSTKGRL